MKNTSNADATFDYEAIYQCSAQGQFVYDNAAVLNYATYWFITTAEYNKTDAEHGARLEIVLADKICLSIGRQPDKSSTEMLGFFFGHAGGCNRLMRL